MRSKWKIEVHVCFAQSNQASHFGASAGMPSFETEFGLGENRVAGGGYLDLPSRLAMVDDIRPIPAGRTRNT